MRLSFFIRVALIAYVLMFHCHFVCDLLTGHKLSCNLKMKQEKPQASETNPTYFMYRCILGDSNPTFHSLCCLGQAWKIDQYRPCITIGQDLLNLATISVS